jgi:hypothetical protein
MHLETTAGLLVDRTCNAPGHIRDVRTHDHPPWRDAIPQHPKKAFRKPLYLTKEFSIAIVEGEQIKKVYIKPTEYLTPGVSLTVYAGDEGHVTPLPFFVCKKNIEIEVPYSAPRLVLNLEGERP